MPDFDSGKPDDKIIINGHAPGLAFHISHSGDGQIAIFRPGGEGGWFDTKELAQTIAKFFGERL